ncbi:hypothetical protein QBC36DRAFT_340995 [Triangularia setosa]|uniref:Uncharacterized protein n=1 Tax=Triangularia setosa TaxID=2587417 RepID=A0AAN6VXA4_9PEZI|nr:hypothetical protein QBC36DRAFT_340995 [Podospora setosa]
MPLPDSRSATPSQRSTPSSLRNALLRSRTPPVHSSPLSRHSTLNTPSTSLNRTHGHQTPPEEPQVLSRAGPSRAWELRRPPSRTTRPSAIMTSRSHITTSPRPSSTMDGSRISTRSPRLSVLERAQEAKREEDALLARAARRESLAHRLASARTATDGALALTAESPERYTVAPRRLAGQDIPDRNILQQYVGHQSFSADVLAAILQEKHNMDSERASRVMRIWDAVIKCLDDISMSMDIGPRHLTCHSTTGLDGDVPTGMQPPPSPMKPNMGELLSGDRDHSEASHDTTGPKYPCPFRKRNPVRFNIRDHESCAQTPFSFIELRTHIISCHRQTSKPRQCRRCKVRFGSDMTLLEHLMLPKDQICDVNASKHDYDQEDGISPDIEKALHDPNQSSDSWNWESIWHLLFPCDTEIPDSDFHLIIELFEVDHAFDTDEQSLKTSLRDTLRLLLPQESIDDEYCGFLVGQLDLVFQAHRASVMRQCLEHSGSLSTPAAPPLSSSSSDCTTASTETDIQSYSSARRGSKRRSAGLSVLSPSFPSSTGGVKTLKAFACAGQKNRVTSSRVSQLEQKQTTTASSTPTLVNGTPVTENFGSAKRDSNSRESLDSAIGMGVTCCDLCKQEPCRCREVVMSCINASPVIPSSSAFEKDRLEYWRNKDLQEQQLRQNLRRQPTKTLRRAGQIIDHEKAVVHREEEWEREFCALGILNPRSKEVLDTKDVKSKNNEKGGRVTPIDLVKDSASKGDYTEHSPQSFKQRVMRERHFSYVREGGGFLRGG